MLDCSILLKKVIMLGVALLDGDKVLLASIANHLILFDQHFDQFVN
jgi:hypothetical protein